MEQNSQVERTLIEHTTTIKELEKRVTELESNSKVQSFQFRIIMDSLQELKNDLKEIKSKPSKRWDLIITTAITGIVGWLIGSVLK